MSSVKNDVASRTRFYGRIPAWLGNSGPECDVVISTRIRLARNIAGYRFPARASAREKQKVFNEASGALCDTLKTLDVAAFNIRQLNKIEQHFMFEDRRVTMELLKGEGDRGVVCDVSGRLNVMINEEDHLRMQVMDSGFCAPQMWELTDALDASTGLRLKYAYSERLGFLTSVPTNSGTGLRVSYLMHLPGLVLTKAIDPVLQAASQMGIATRGFFGEHSEVVGNFFQLSNHATMGASEEELIKSADKTIKEIIGHERDAREKLLKDARLEVSDKVWRAHGILCNARVVTVPEMLNLTSALRFGVDSGIYKEHTIDDINWIMKLCMPAHLQFFMSGKYETFPEADEARADALRALFTLKPETAVKGSGDGSGSSGSVGNDRSVESEPKKIGSVKKSAAVKKVVVKKVAKKVVKKAGRKSQ